MKESATMYGHREFLSAWLNARKYEDAHEDLCDYHD
jgi:hypothetical protein